VPATRPTRASHRRRTARATSGSCSPMDSCPWPATRCAPTSPRWARSWSRSWSPTCQTSGAGALLHPCGWARHAGRAGAQPRPLRLAHGAVTDDALPLRQHLDTSSSSLWYEEAGMWSRSWRTECAAMLVRLQLYHPRC
jgi:hypothetical protein